VIVLSGLDLEEITDRYLNDTRDPRPDRPWVTLGMISSVDGSAVVDGGSTALGGPPDRAVFRALRAVSDVVLTGASTVRAERYRAPRLPDRLEAWRRSQGLSLAPRVAVVSNTLDLDLTDSLKEDRPIILTSLSAPPRRVEELAPHAEVVVAGVDRVDLVEGLAELRRRGVGRVVLEGGPRLNGQMTGLLDEACVTISPTIAAGEGQRIIVGGEGVPTTRLDRMIESDGFLLLRYLVDVS
jgi:riboflavin biosynthesis pyrimidine reductase